MREIPLTQGKVAFVDDGDYEWLNQWHWCYSDGYAARGISVGGRKGKSLTIRMHREILGAKPGQIIDHKNGNPLDNCRDNLRFCTCQQNQYNARAQVNNASGYKGIHFHKRWRHWVATIRQGNRIFLGNFHSPEEAARAYDAKARELFGDFAHCNFPFEVAIDANL